MPWSLEARKWKPASPSVAAVLVEQRRYSTAFTTQFFPLCFETCFLSIKTSCLNSALSLQNPGLEHNFRLTGPVPRIHGLVGAHEIHQKKRLKNNKKATAEVMLAHVFSNPGDV